MRAIKSDMFHSIHKTCEQCGKHLTLKSTRDVERKRFCSRKCGGTFVGSMQKHSRDKPFISVRGGTENRRWQKGYARYVWFEGKWRQEHRVVAEKALGRSLLKKEIVHHINCDSLDNEPTNLLICDNAYHRWLHNEYSRRFGQMMFNNGETNACKL